MTIHALFSNFNFKIHWLASVIAQTGNFFTVVALPWLVLGVTDNNPWVMSTVMATSSLPQALFMLFGGVLVDRFSPLTILYLSRSVFVVVMASLAFFVYFDKAALWALYAYAFVLGTLGAIAIPASQALLPAMVSPSYLAVANGVIMGSTQLAQIFGPIMAGWLIWSVKMWRGVAEMQVDFVAIAVAFAIDCLGVIGAIFLMTLMRIPAIAGKKEKIFLMLRQGFLFCWRDKGIALVLCYLMLISFFLHGTLMAGLPVFTKLHLGLAERAYGNLYAMVGVGTVIGIGLGILFSPSARQLGCVVLGCDLVNGVALFALGETAHFYSAAVCLVSMGICGGIVMVAGTTWFQQRTPDYLMGRVISILMFAILGLVPLSASIVGIFMGHYPVTVIVSASGIIIAFAALVGLMFPSVRQMGNAPTIQLKPVASLR